MNLTQALRPLLLLMALVVGQPVCAALHEPNPANFGNLQAAPSNCDDCFSGPVSFGAGHSLNFFGTTYGGVFVGSNGYVTLGAGSSDFTPVALDVQAIAPMIAGLYTDLDTRDDAGSQVFVNTATPGQIIVTWVGNGHFNRNYAVRSTFQLVIRSNQFAVPPGEGRIGFFYDSVTDGAVASAGFGDGLAASNPGEQAFHTGAASALSGSAGRWYNLAAGGVPVPSVPSHAAAIPSLSEGAALVVAALMMLAMRLVRRRDF